LLFTLAAFGFQSPGELGTTVSSPPATQAKPATVLPPPLAVAAAEPLRDESTPYPIDLVTALRLADSSNPTIAVAEARVREAYALWRQARVLWLPNLETGPAYLRHDGLVQNAAGLVFPTSKWNFFEGGGAALSVETSDALFAPLVARRLLNAQTAAAQATRNAIQLQAALAYLDLLRAQGNLAVNTQTLANAREMLRLAEAAEKSGFGATPADANRGRVEVEFRKQERLRLQSQTAVASARLTQLLLLDPTVQLQPIEPAVVPLTLIADNTSLGELVATGIANRPEVAESQSLAGASEARWRQARIAPLLPRLEVDYLAGNFSGGLDSSTMRSGGRGDGLAQAVWTLHNLGAGDVARARATRARLEETEFHIREVTAQVATDVTTAANTLTARQRSLESARKSVQQAEEMWRRLLRWTFEVAFRGVGRYQAVELLLAEQALNQSQTTYLLEMIEYNQAQFELYWALGQPPLNALPGAPPRPMSIQGAHP
jgi:outer membrane protein TolC